MPEYTIVTIRLPSQLELDFMQRVISDGYGMKGKSKWVCEAVKYFMQLEDFEDYVEYADDFNSTEKNQAKTGEIKKHSKSKLQSLYFDENFVKEMNDAVIRVRKKYPHLEGVRSLMIRSSIIQRLFRGKESYSKI